MKVLYYMPYFSVGAAYWIYLGWKHAFEDAGHQFFELIKHDNLLEQATRVNPDILFITNFIDLSRTKNALLSIRERGTKVFLVVDWPMREDWVEIIRHKDVADVSFGEREPESMREFEAATGRAYNLIPNAADKRLHFPTHPVKKYEYDIVYLGAYLPKKKRQFEEILLPLRKKYKVGIFGPNWTLRDNILRSAQFICRKLNLIKLADVFNQMRILIHPNEENQLYSSAKICLNFHEREEDGSQPHYIVNQRAFKIPACGGFEICDYVPALRKYFYEDEVIMAQEPRDWFEKIEYYLKNDDERKRIQQKGTARALRDHTYANRVQEVLRLAGL